MCSWHMITLVNLKSYMYSLSWQLYISSYVFYPYRSPPLNLIIIRLNRDTAVRYAALSLLSQSISLQCCLSQLTRVWLLSLTTVMKHEISLEAFGL